MRLLSDVLSDIKEIYLTAKQQGRIIESFTSREVHAATPKTPQPTRNWTPEFSALMAQVKPLRGGGGQPAINSPVFSLIKASVELGQFAVSTPNDLKQLWKSLEKVERGSAKG